MNGTIRKLDERKLYGFVRNENGADYFFHRDDFVGHWNDLIEDFHRENEIKVDFMPDKTDKGLRARNVNRLNWPNQAV